MLWNKKEASTAGDRITLGGAESDQVNMICRVLLLYCIVFALSCTAIVLYCVDFSSTIMFYCVDLSCTTMKFKIEYG